MISNIRGTEKRNSPSRKIEYRHQQSYRNYVNSINQKINKRYYTKGGFVTLRQNELKDNIAEMLEEVSDVKL